MPNSLYMPDSHFIDAISVHASIIILATVFLTNDAAFGQLPGLQFQQRDLHDFHPELRVLLLVCLCSCACARVLVLACLCSLCLCCRVLVLACLCLCAFSELLRASRPSRPH